VTQRIDPVGPRRDLAPVELRVLTPLEREAEKRRRERERERRRRAPQPAPEPSPDGPAPGGLDVRA
jgi:hypothetical protein